LEHKHEEGGVCVTDLGQAERFRADVLAEPATLSALLYAYREPGSPFAALGEIRARRILFLGVRARPSNSPSAGT